MDNTAVVHVLNKFTKSDQMSIIRKLVLLLLQYNIQNRAEYIHIKDICIADALSCSQCTRFRLLVPEAEQ